MDARIEAPFEQAGGRVILPATSGHWAALTAVRAVSSSPAKAASEAGGRPITTARGLREPH